MVLAFLESRLVPNCVLTLMESVRWPEGALSLRETELERLVVLALLGSGLEPNCVLTLMESVRWPEGALLLRETGLERLVVLALLESGLEPSGIDLTQFNLISLPY